MVANNFVFNPVQKRKERRLLASFFAGNQEAYWQIWTLYDQSIYRYCLSLMDNNIEDAEDAKQEIMCKVFLKLNQYQQCLTSLNRLLITIARNTCWDILRRKRAICWVALKEEYMAESEQETPEMVAIRLEQKYYLESAIAQLPSRQSDVLTYYYFCGIPHGKIAEKLNIKPSTSRKHAARGIQKLRKHLAQREHCPPYKV